MAVPSDAALHGALKEGGYAPCILCPIRCLSLQRCLESGQTFSWQRLSPSSWANILKGHLAILSEDGRKQGEVCATLSVRHTLSEDGNVLYWVAEGAPEEERAALAATLHDYFRLECDLDALYATWSAADAHFAARQAAFGGIRLLRQDPFESLVAFICSQNNTIARITAMVRLLKDAYGALRVPISGLPAAAPVCSFPTARELAAVPLLAEALGSARFGYRARYVSGAARAVAAGDVDLAALARDEDARAAARALQVLVGVGPKVADCVALTGLGHASIVPIDTHIWRVARTHYAGMPAGERAMTPAIYEAISRRFQEIFGALAGWAHLIIFASQVKERAAKRRK